MAVVDNQVGLSELFLHPTERYMSRDPKDVMFQSRHQKAHSDFTFSAPLRPTTRGEKTQLRPQGSRACSAKLYHERQGQRCWPDPCRVCRLQE